MLLRREKILKVACNQRITPSLEFSSTPQMLSAVVWKGVDYSDENQSFGTFCLRFKTVEIKDEFLSIVKSLSANMSQASQKSPEASRLFGSADNDSPQTTTYQPSHAFDANNTPKSPNFAASLSNTSNISFVSPTKDSETKSDVSGTGPFLFAQAISNLNVGQTFGTSSEKFKIDFTVKPVFKQGFSAKNNPNPEAETDFAAEANREEEEDPESK